MLEDRFLAGGFHEIESLLCCTLLWGRDWFGRSVKGTIEPSDIRVLEPRKRRIEADKGSVNRAPGSVRRTIDVTSCASKVCVPRR